ncbi:OB-fold nucleic acid binding domain-containing protein [Candidatus Magnetomonas plexicatena]|uniref:OB-fold nucleic acid binding domain-containing protein n=1 Tax=Candidatus Magnetomonas plexicatena TaxID=2552947 RepID=UPI00110224B4|nr:hypothetical protein E2O03_002975 [Nitrospirales bacterium LBB_01]
MAQTALTEQTNIMNSRISALHDTYRAALRKGGNNMRRIFFLTVIITMLLMQNVRAEETGGYDSNTEVTVNGVVAEAGMSMMGPCVFTIHSADKTFEVMTGPRWYLNQIGLDIKTGMKLVVTGSKFYDRKGQLSIAAYSIEIPAESKTYLFRDSSTQRPLWHGQGRGRWR